MGQEKYEVWFAGIRGLGARKKYLLHEALKSCRNAYYIEETQLKKFPFLTEKDCQEIRQAQKRKDPEKICEEMKKKGNVIALLPIGVFLVLYLGLGILFEYVMKIPMGFYLSLIHI